MDDENNGIVVHMNRTRHAVKWQDASTIDQEQNWTKRKVKEAIHIQNQRANMNLDNGRYLNPTWCTLGLT